MNEETTERETGFYVDPKRDCPHINRHFVVKDLPSIATNAPCEVCNHAHENWCCLTCGKRYCSRYVKGHMKEHNEETGHAICVSYSDFSFWCYRCDSYIAHGTLAKLLKYLNEAKFNFSGSPYDRANTAMVEAEEKEDKEDDVQEKIRTLGKWIKESKHFICFTGAGISTSAGVPDYRGPQGVWTLRAKGEARATESVDTLSAIPTPCHMALVKLQNDGILKHLISQNVDGLHRKSGILPENISELHGNTNTEICEKCNKVYLRDFHCQLGNSVRNRHYTGRTCSIKGCGGLLRDSIINFGENLPQQELSRSFRESKTADLCVTLGSSLTVTPASHIPKSVVKKKDGSRLVIINLQKTPLDKFADLKISAKCDTVMIGVMKELGLEIPPFKLQRMVVISHVQAEKSGKYIVSVRAIDLDGTCDATVFRGAQFTHEGRTEKIETEPLQWTSSLKSGDVVDIELCFMGHYGEPPLTVSYPIGEGEGAKVLLLTYDPTTGKWETEALEASIKS